MSTAVYYRVSTADKGQDIDTQRHAVKAYLDKRGEAYEAVEYTDTQSGKFNTRAGFQRLMRDVRDGKVTRLLVFALDRLSRDFMTLLNALNTFQIQKVKLETLEGEGFDFDSVQSKLLSSIKAYQAESERIKTGERVKAGMSRARDNGVRLGAPKGSKSNRGYRKTYDPSMVQDIKDYHDKGLAWSTIAVIISKTYGQVSSGTVINIARRARDSAA